MAKNRITPEVAQKAAVDFERNADSIRAINNKCYGDLEALLSSYSGRAAGGFSNTMTAIKTQMDGISQQLASQSENVKMAKTGYVNTDEDAAANANRVGQSIAQGPISAGLR